MRYRFFAAGVGLPLISLFTVIMYFFLVADRLPDPIAIRWGLDGEPIGFVAKESFVVSYSINFFGVYGLMLALAVFHENKPLRRFILGAINGSAWLMGVITLGIMVVQLDKVQPVSNSWWMVVWGLVGGIVGGWVGAMIAGPSFALAPSFAPAPAEAKRHPIAPGHTAVWIGYTPVSSVMVVAAGLMLVEGVVLSLVASWHVGLLVASVAMLIVAMASYRLTIGLNGLEVAGWLVGFPRVRVRLTDIRAAEVGTVDALRFLGWGIRAGFKETAIITESGPALVLERTDKHVIRISMANPEEAAAVLSTLMDQRAEQALMSVAE